MASLCSPSPRSQSVVQTQPQKNCFLGGERRRKTSRHWGVRGLLPCRAPSEPETDTDGSQQGACKQACAEPCARAWAGRSSPGSSIRLQFAPLPGWARPPNSRIPPTSKVKLLFSQVPGWLDSKALAAKAENVALLWRIQMWLRFQEFGPSVTGIW